jgi:predicted transcriptional regulator of viral defense system
MEVSKAELVARMVRKAGVFQPRELDRVGIPRQYLRQAKDRGLVRQVRRGLYLAEGSRATEHHTLVEAVKRVPHGVICLLSALRFYGLTTQAPHEIWMAIVHKARRTRADYPPMRIVRFSGAALSYGIEERKSKALPSESLVRQRRWPIVSSTATRLVWRSRWKHRAIATGSGNHDG